MFRFASPYLLLMMGTIPLAAWYRRRRHAMPALAGSDRHPFPDAAPSPMVRVARLLPALYYTLMMPQKAVNLAERDAAGTVNDRMTGANYFWIVLGVILWLFAGLGLLVTFGIFQAPQ